MEKLLPLLSGSFKSHLKNIANTYDNQIAKELCDVDDLIILYNNSIIYNRIDSLKALKAHIDSIITDEVRALSMRENIFEISFTPKYRSLIYTLNGL